MIPVVLESPYGGDVVTNLRYLRACMADCLARGEAPFASHGLYPGVLDDTNPEEREHGMQAGFAWASLADRAVVYTDRGVTPGMVRGIHLHQSRHLEIEFRQLGEGWAGLAFTPSGAISP